jgi:ketosteroid isomerase-like protein
LSWFTYFLLKGMEPGVASRRERAHHLLGARSHAGAFRQPQAHARLAACRHRGGEFLLLSTAQGTPKLPPLPSISRQTLRDLGFLTRSDAPEAVGAGMDRMREPIDRIFEAWTRKDLALYAAQFDRGVVQTGRLKGGGSYQRGYEQIVERRRADFARLERVDVLKYEVMYQGSEGGEASFGARYSMDFHWRDGRVTREHNINECYRVRRVAGSERWAIVRNDDYQSRICYQ